MNILLIGVWSTLLILVVLVIILLIRTRSGRMSGSAGYGSGSLPRELREEMYRSRQETIGMVQSSVKNMGDMLSQAQRESMELQSRRLSELNKQFARTSMDIEQRLENIRISMEKKVSNMTEENNRQLAEMRNTVDEKLQSTLEKRLTESFKRVTDQLETVHKGLGEMHSLAVNVGDLKNVLTNVKIRGTWGEYQLGNILQQMLSPDQYGQNVHPNPAKATNVVEYAVKLPGNDASDIPVYLPIDAKFPKEDYELLVNASEAGDPERVAAARKNLLGRVRIFAKEIHDKYIEPPYTTNFAIMFMPVEAIYAEVLREPGFFEELQRAYKVTITGPTTLAAFLNSLQMGFRTLAITKRSDEIWKTLSAVKTEFGNFSTVLDQVYDQVNKAQNTLGKLRTTRVNKMNIRLRGLETIDGAQAQHLLGLDAASDDAGEEEAL